MKYIKIIVILLVSVLCSSFLYSKEEKVLESCNSPDIIDKVKMGLSKKYPGNLGIEFYLYESKPVLDKDKFLVLPCSASFFVKMQEEFIKVTLTYTIISFKNKEDRENFFKNLKELELKRKLENYNKPKISV